MGVHGWARAADVLIARAEARHGDGHGAEALRRADARGRLRTQARRRNKSLFPGLSRPPPGKLSSLVASGASCSFRAASLAEEMLLAAGQAVARTMAATRLSRGGPGGARKTTRAGW